MLVPAGRYLSGTIHLRSGVTLHLDAGARLVGTTNLAHYAQPTPPAFMPEAKWGKWHRGLIIGENVEDVAITGTGVIDGNKVFDPTGEERMRGPHTIIFVNCRRFTLRDVTIVESANYAVFFQASDDVEIRNVKFVGGWDGVHWRGAPERWCQNVNIIGCQFFTGDDAIAGRYWNNTRGVMLDEWKAPQHTAPQNDRSIKLGELHTPMQNAPPHPAPGGSASSPAVPADGGRLADAVQRP